MKPTILISSQDPDFFLIFGHILDTDGFSSELVSDRAETSRLALERRPAAIILDCQPNDFVVWSICAQLKQDPALADIPVVALLAKDAQTYLELLKAGVDEVFQRPFAPLRLLTYLRSKRADSDHKNGAKPGRLLRHSGLELSQETHRVHFGGDEIRLPPIEYKLLQHLMNAPEKVFSREELIEAAWPDNASADARSVDVHIGRLRKALKTATGQNLIRTVRTAGYALEQGEAETP